MIAGFEQEALYTFSMEQKRKQNTFYFIMTFAFKQHVIVLIKLFSLYFSSVQI